MATDYLSQWQNSQWQPATSSQQPVSPTLDPNLINYSNQQWSYGGTNPFQQGTPGYGMFNQWFGGGTGGTGGTGTGGTGTGGTGTGTWQQSNPFQPLQQGAPFFGSWPTSGGGMNDLYRNFYDPGMTAALQMAQMGVGFNPYPGSTTSPFTPMQRDALSGIRGLASQGNPMLGPAMNFGQNLMSSGGLTPYMQQMLGSLGGVASGQNDISGWEHFQRLYANPITSMQNQARNYYGSVLGGAGGLDPSIWNMDPLTGMQQLAQRGFTDMFRNPLTGLQQGAATNLEALYGGTRGLSSSERNLADMGSGRYLTEGNPYANAILEEQMKRAQALIESDASRKGREGSPYAAGRTAEELGFISKQFAQDQYERDKNLMLQANQLMDQQAGRRFGEGLSATGAIAGLGQQGFANRAGMAGQLAGLGQQEFQNLVNLLGQGQANQMYNTGLQTSMADRMGSLGQQQWMNQMAALQGRVGLEGTNLANMMQAAMGGLQGAGSGQRLAYDASRQAPILGAARYSDMDRLFGAGGMVQGQQQSQLSDDVQRWLQAQQAPWQQLGAYMNALQGGSGLLGNIGNYVNSTNQMQAAQPSTWQQLLGGGMLGLNALGNFGTGGLFGGLGSLFGGSGGLF